MAFLVMGLSQMISPNWYHGARPQVVSGDTKIITTEPWEESIC